MEMEDDLETDDLEHDHSVDEDFVIEDNNAFLMAMGEGSRIEIHAADAEKESWTNLEMTAEAGAGEITLQEETGWEVGDKIAIASTSTDWEEAEEFYVLAISDDGKTITLGDENGEPATLEFTHLGITESYDNGLEGEDSLVMDVEMRAEVALLSRNVTIQGDEDSVDDGFGGHLMVMDGAEMYIEGAEFFRMGQEDILGRYPIHWHMLGDAEGQYVTNVSIHASYQKGTTIHGTSNILYEDNVIYDHVGHGVFFEDGSENNNLIYGNLVFSTQESDTGEPIPTDGEHASSFWIENPNNVLIGNVAAGSESNGFWIFEGQLHGLSLETYVGDAGQLDQLVFIGNSGHSTSGQNGAGGTDKILGIDGTITDDLDFQQSTLVADFGVIEGFTAYAGEVWALTHEMVFSDSAFIDVRFFTRHENVIQDTVFDSGDIIVYRDGGGQYDNVLLVDGAEFVTISSNHVNTPSVFNNVVSIGGNRNINHTNSDVNQQSIIDLDGSYTGIVGAFLTPDGTHAVFNAAPFAEQLDVNSNDEGYVSAYTIGATEVTALGIDGAVRVVRANDGASIDSLSTSNDSRVQGDDNEDSSDANYEFYTTAGMPQDVAYLIDFEDLPEDLTLNLANVREGESVVYEVANVSAVGEVAGGIEVGSFEELVDSDVTAYMLDGESLFIRIVADDVEVQEDRPVVDLLADYRAFGKIEITGLVEGDAVEHGARELDEDLLLAIAEMEPREEAEDPEPAEPAVDPNSSYIGYDLLMNEAQSVDDVVDTMAKGSFEVNYDVATQTVSIVGEFSDLSSDITMIHLHAGVEGEAGVVIGDLTFDTTDMRNGTFEGSVVLSDEEAALLLADGTYVNLHTVDNESGELRGQVELYAAGDFVLDRYDSTSDTTVVTDDMARWSDPDTWGDAGVPGADDVVVINAGQTVILDVDAVVKGIIVNGGELIIEDGDDLSIDLSTDYLLVIEGGLFQAGTEDDLLDTDFTLTLEGDDPDFDLEVGKYVLGDMPNTVFPAIAAAADDDSDHDMSEENDADEDMTDEDMTDEDMIDEDMTDEDMTDEDMTDEDMMDEDMTDGDDTDDHSDHDMSDEDDTDEEDTEDDVYDDDLYAEDDTDEDDTEDDLYDEYTEDGSDDGSTEGDTEDDMSDEEDEDDTEYDMSDEEDADTDDDTETDADAQNTAAFMINIVDLTSSEALSEIGAGSTLANEAIGNDDAALSIDPQMAMGSLAIRIGDHVQVVNTEQEDEDDVVDIGLPEGAVFEPGETVEIQVVAYDGADATGDVLGEASYSIEVPEETVEEDDSDDNFLVEVFDSIIDFLTGLFGGGSDDDIVPATAAFEQSEILLSDLLPTIDLEDNLAVIDDEEPEMVA